MTIMQFLQFTWAVALLVSRTTVIADPIMTTEQHQHHLLMSQPRVLRNLPSIDGDDLSIGGLERPSRNSIPTEAPILAPVNGGDDHSVEYNNNDSTATSTLVEARPIRRRILPFILSLSPLTATPAYQEQTQIAGIIESLLETAMMGKYNTADTDASQASVNYVGLTDILNISHTELTSTVEITMRGMVYFEEGMSDVPSEEDLAQWIVQVALPSETVLPALWGVLRQVRNASTRLVSPISTQTPTLAPTTLATTVDSTESPTISPTIVTATTTSAPTVATDSPTASPKTSSPSTTPPTLPTESPTTLSPTAAPSTLEPTEPPLVPTASPVAFTESPTLTATAAAMAEPTVAPVLVDDPSTTLPNQSPSVMLPTLTSSLPPSAWLDVDTASSRPDQSPNTLHASPPPSQSPSVLFDTTPSVVLASTKEGRVGINDDSINVNVLIGCGVGGFLALVLVSIMLVKLTRRRHRYLRKNENCSPAKQRLSNDDDSSRSELSGGNEQLVTMDATNIINVGNEEVLAGYMHLGDPRETSSQDATETSQNPAQAPDLETGGERSNDSGSIPRSPSQVSRTRSAGANDAEIASNTADGAATMALWSAFFYRSKSPPPDATNNLGLAPEELTENDAGAETDGTFSDIEDAISIEPDIVSATKTIESFENRALQDYVVKKDMLESPATAVCIVNSKDQQARTTSELSLNKSEAEEERMKNEIMMPNPYLRKSFNGTQPAEDKSVSCALQPTDTSAATLAQREECVFRANSYDDEEEELERRPSGFTRMVPKSWWRPSGNDNKKTLKTSKCSPAVTVAVQDQEDEETAFEITPSDGWDPADCDLGSKGPSNGEEHFKIKMKKAKKQSHQTVKNESISSDTETRSSQSAQQSCVKNGGRNGKLFEYNSNYHFDNFSISSEDSTSLKLDSAHSF